MNVIKKNLFVLFFFIALAGYFMFLQWSPSFPDPDSFYHIKITALMQDNLIIKEFPWIQFADFTHNFTDHHFLYHLFLIPFVFLFPPLVGGKIATGLFALIAILAFYFSLKKWQIKAPLFFVLILLSSAPFIFRMNLAKTSALSLVILLLALHFIWQKKYWALGLVSFFYVWFYGGWSLLIILLLSHTLGWWLVKKQIDWRLLLTVATGLGLGLIINPYFPHNLLFYWQQMIQIGLVNYQSQIQVGMEWYPYPLLDLLANNIFIFLLGILSLLFLIYLIKYNIPIVKKGLEEHFSKILSLFIFSGILFILTVKSQRFIEYFVPFSILAIAHLINALLPENFSLKQEIKKGVKNKTNALLLSYLFIVFILFFALNTLKLQENLTVRYSWNYLEQASLWLKNNTPPQSLIFNANWGDWPMLFYHNTHNTYIIGLDPTFFYLKDSQLYQEWIKIGRGQVKENLAEKIKKDFGAKWVLVKNSETEFLFSIRENEDFELRYADQEVKVYKLH